MSQKRLLVVDDDPTTRYALQMMFARQGWTVVVASTMAEGLATLRSGEPPRFLILDLNLPDGPGETILRAVRADGLPTRVAVCSGLDDPGRIAEVWSLRPDLLLAKPVDPGPVMHLSAAAG